MRISGELRAAGAVHVLEPADPGYDAAVAGFDLDSRMRPDVVVDAHSAGEVASAVTVAAHQGAPLTVLGTGHGRLVDIDGGLAIGTRAMTDIEIDVDGRTARVEAGCRWDQVLDATAPHGLAAPCGSAPSVGVVGYLLGGGLGPLASSIGFSSDHVRAIEVVTPRTGPVTATPDTHPDLFWALRGGKGGLGIVTAVTIDLLELSEVAGGGLYFAADVAPAVLHAYAQWAPSLPSSSTTSVAILRLPDIAVLPEQIRGRHVVHVRFASLEPLSVATAQLDALHAVATPILDTVAVLPYADLGTIHGDPTEPMPTANGTASLENLDTGAIDALLAAAGPDVDVALAAVEIRTLGRATQQNPKGPDAVGGRGTSHILNVFAAPDPTVTQNDRLAAVSHALNSTRPWHTPVTLINFIGRANDPNVIANSWSLEQNEQLDSVRDYYDPNHLFPYARHTSSTW